MFTALIFDFDGLILDTETPVFNAWQEIYAEYGADLPIDLCGPIIGGNGFSDFDATGHLEELLGRSLDRAALRSRWQRRGDELVALQPILPGVLEDLQDARRLGLRLAIASSSPHGWVDGHLVRLGLSGFFEVVLCCEDIARVKPHPDLFLAALAAVHARPEEALVLEDSPNGVRAAKAAGARVVAVPNPLTSHLDITGADMLLDSLAALPLAGLLHRLGETLEIRPEMPGDIPGIRMLNLSAFHQPNEADLVDLVRSRGKLTLSLVAVNEGHVLGHILFSPVTLEPRRPGLRGLGLGPVAVLPECQRSGIGSRLIRAGLQWCKEAGYDFVVLLGDPAYYSRFGFRPGRLCGLTSDYTEGDEFQVLELRPGALAQNGGRVRYVSQFREAGC